MSAHHESLSHGSVAKADEQESNQTFQVARQDSLVMFGAALGGAVLGMLLTLLILAIVNGGTLRFTGNSSLIARWERAYKELDANVNINAKNNLTLREDVLGVIELVNGRLDEQDTNIDSIHGNVEELNVTRGQVDTLVGALSGAVDSIRGVEGSVQDSASAVEAELPAVEPVVGTVSVLFFADVNGNSEMDSGEENLLGIRASLVDSNGNAVSSLESTDGGMNFEELSPGQYTLVVDDSGEYALKSNELGSIVIPEEGGEQVVYVAVETN